MEASSWDALRKQVTRPSDPTRFFFPSAVPWILSVPLSRLRSPVRVSQVSTWDLAPVNSAMEWGYRRAEVRRDDFGGGCSVGR